MKPILIVLAGNTFPDIRVRLGDFSEWIAAGLGAGSPHDIVDSRTVDDMPDPMDFSGVIVSGSHAMVSDREAWSERLAHWMKACVAKGVPLLGICYGHQLLAHAFGATVKARDVGVEIGTHRISLLAPAASDLLFGESDATFLAHLVHYQSVVHLPREAVLLAQSDAEACQAFRIGGLAWGVQFHPEFSSDAMRGYVSQLRPALLETGLDIHQLKQGIGETSEAARLLRRFAAIARAVDRSAMGTDSVGKG